MEALKSKSSPHFKAEALFKEWSTSTDIPLEEIKRIHPLNLLEVLKITHQQFLHRDLPHMEQSIYQLFHREKNSNPLLLALCGFFVDYKAKLECHILSEERLLFPHLERLFGSESACSTSRMTVLEALDDFEEQHSDVEEDLKRVRSTIEHTLVNRPKPLPFRIFLTQLELFERQLHVHAVIEDEVLLPIAREICGKQQ